MKAWALILGVLTASPAAAQASYVYVAPGQTFDGVHGCACPDGPPSSSGGRFKGSASYPIQGERRGPNDTYARPPGPSPYAPGYDRGYYRDYYPAPQYGYTYGSAHGRGYGYSGAYAPPDDHGGADR